MHSARALLVILVLALIFISTQGVVHNVTKLGITREVNFPLKSAEIDGRMVVVDSRWVEARIEVGKSRFKGKNLINQTFFSGTVEKG